MVSIQMDPTNLKMNWQSQTPLKYTGIICAYEHHGNESVIFIHLLRLWVFIGDILLRKMEKTKLSHQVYTNSGDPSKTFWSKFHILWNMNILHAILSPSPFLSILLTALNIIWYNYEKLSKFLLNFYKFL